MVLKIFCVCIAGKESSCKQIFLVDGLQSSHQYIYNSINKDSVFNEERMEEREGIPALKPLVRGWCPVCSVGEKV